MNKVLKFLTCAVLGGTMMFTAAACNSCSDDENPNGEQKYNPEERALGLSISALDGNFNPFYYTSLSDGQVISMTQASLITSDLDANGDIAAVAGENYPTVAKDYSITYYKDRAATQVGTSAEAAKGGSTAYEFLIKNGMKFSDGTDLTIKDVLFNFYVYLDPVYTGSNTMYSVDIQGLDAYQFNDSTLLEEGNEGNTNEISAKAAERFQNLLKLGDTSSSGWTKDQLFATENGESDYNKVLEYFEDELNSDWTSMESGWQETYKVNYTFTEAWQAYLFMEGIVTAQTRKLTNGSIVEIRVDPNDTSRELTYGTDEYKNGKIKTTLDQWVEGAYQGDYPRTGAQGILDDIAALGNDDSAKKQYAIDKVYNNYLGNDTGIASVLSYWATGSTMYNYIFASERGKALEGSNNPMYYIKGISTYTTKTFNGVDLGEDYNVLKIVINDVDPVAIWQFGITVAPMNYYSGTYEAKNYITSFNGNNVDYSGVGTENTCFGVKRGDLDFFEKVVKGSGEGKSGLPVGAGVYKASTVNGGTATSKGQFFDNNIVYYERNTNFHTMGAEIENAKIKYLKYKVLDDDRILTSIQTENIDYGEPNATSTNKNTIDSNRDVLGSYEYDTNGYGYVGINPTHVPDIEIRKIIMQSMDISRAQSYYGDLASELYRPMSKTSWAYPKGATAYYPQYINSADIKTKLTQLGYKDSGDGVYEKDGHRLKYTFTIAGANTDHPAYNMFQSAARLLNDSGFEITVNTDSNALMELTRGGLAVWAAAWSAGVDPDMYQVYHKDSQATSVLNWGYRTILNDTTGKYLTEPGLINDLSKKIEEARETLVQSERAGIYSECLDLVMQLCVELPVYQRKDLCVFNKTIIDEKTLNQNPNSTVGVIDRIWEVNYL